MMISYHSFHIERLQSDDLVFVHQLGRYFMKMINTAVIDLLVDACDLALLLLYVQAFGKRPLPYGLALLRIAYDIHLDHARQRMLLAVKLSLIFRKVFVI